MNTLTEGARPSVDDTGSQTVDIARLIREASAADHRATESRGFITRLMGGELALEAEACEALLAEVTVAFEFNGRIFDELDEESWRS